MSELGALKVRMDVWSCLQLSVPGLIGTWSPSEASSLNIRAPVEYSQLEQLINTHRFENEKLTHTCQGGLAWPASEEEMVANQTLVGPVVLDFPNKNHQCEQCYYYSIYYSDKGA